MDRIKTVAMYLPQFHRTKENDAWWGEGFTEWTAVQAAKPLYPGHVQPRKPLDGNYYDLTEKRALEWQAGLAAKYGVDCLCFYHYWFGNEKLLLERPAENLLAWKDVAMPFCFCWATGTWARTWSNCGNWSWTPRFDKKREDDLEAVRKRQGILVEQVFGGREDWERHIDYLLPFFKDDRYLKLDGKPVFVFYGAESVYCLEEMLELWNGRLREAGIPGLYVAGVNLSMSASAALDADIRLRNGGRGAALAPYARRGPEDLWMVDYDRLWQGYLAEKRIPGRRTYDCITVAYDDTPRRGGQGTVYEGVSPEKFGQYYQAMLRRSLAEGNRLIFINAWNEWGEGMYLEPDEQNGYAYLAALRAAQKAVTSEMPVTAEEKGPFLVQEAYMQQLSRTAYKNKREVRLLLRWMQQREQGKHPDAYLLQKGYRRIAIYGMAMKGERLRNELEGTEVKVIYGVDRAKNAVTGDLPMYDLQDDLPPVDAIVVSVITEFLPIYRNLRKKTDVPILSLEELIFEG